jgi:hypothetical protein
MTLFRLQGYSNHKISGDIFWFNTAVTNIIDCFLNLLETVTSAQHLELVVVESLDPHTKPIETESRMEVVEL